MHLHAPTVANRTTDKMLEARNEFAEAGIGITVVFVGFPEDDYTTPETVKSTVGLVPTKLRSERLKETLAIADYARDLGVDAIGMHLGFVPTDPQASAFGEIVEATRKVCDHCASNSQFFHLETGQETAQELAKFIMAVNRPNLAVNFDPANMILYGLEIR